LSHFPDKFRSELKGTTFDIDYYFILLTIEVISFQIWGRQTALTGKAVGLIFCFLFSLTYFLLLVASLPHAFYSRGREYQRTFTKFSDVVFL
jgi:hypothetical protein